MPGDSAPGDLSPGSPLVVDIRNRADRARTGTISGCLHIRRNVLEWRLDPSSPHAHRAMKSHDQPVVLFCNQGYASSLAVESLSRLGLSAVSDLEGGIEAWAKAGFPVVSPDRTPDPAPLRP